MNADSNSVNNNKGGVKECLTGLQWQNNGCYVPTSQKTKYNSRCCYVRRDYSTCLILYTIVAVLTNYSVSGGWNSLTVKRVLNYAALVVASSENLGHLDIEMRLGGGTSLLSPRFFHAAL